MASAFVVIVIVILSQTNPPLTDDNVDCMDAFPSHVFVSEQHCIDELQKCTLDPNTMYRTPYYDDVLCLEKNGIMRK